MEKIINKSMDRADLLTDDAKPVVHGINSLIKSLYAKKLFMTSWYGTLPKDENKDYSGRGIKSLIKSKLEKSKVAKGVGMDNRGNKYQPLENAADDARIPWYLYWEIFWVLHNGPQIKNGMKMLDAGGTASLFTCYLASLGCEVHSVDLNKELIAYGNSIGKSMGWKMFSYEMNMKKLDFPDEYFDHAYSICVFEHLDYEIKKAALSEIARCLKPNGILSITFDYRNPAPALFGKGADTNEKNQLKTKEDIIRNFLSTDCFEVAGNQDFYDNGKSFLVHPTIGNTPYTFGAIFLKKKN